MRRFFILSVLLGMFAITSPAIADSGKIIKVLPQFLDLKGRSAKSPSLFDRDAYQAWLRENPQERSGIRYAVQWKAKETFGTLKLRVELRGITRGSLAREKTIENELKSGSKFSRWENLDFAGEAYKDFGEVTAWRVTLWGGDTLIDEQTSFLWNNSDKAQPPS